MEALCRRGLGFARVSIDAKSRVTGSSLADDDTVLAYQTGAGLGCALSRSQERTLTATLDWRYFGCNDPALKGDVTGTKFHTEIDGHQVQLLVRKMLVPLMHQCRLDAIPEFQPCRQCLFCHIHRSRMLLL